jgi:hypothetical protein
VHAVFAEQAGEQKRLWNRYSGTRVDGEASTAFEYEVPDHLPIEVFNLHLEQKNSLLQGAVYSRPSLEHAWRVRHRGLFYRLAFPQAALTSPDIPVATTTHRYWRVEYASEQSSLGSSVAALQLGWRPHKAVTPTPAAALANRVTVGESVDGCAGVVSACLAASPADGIGKAPGKLVLLQDDNAGSRI